MPAFACPRASTAVPPRLPHPENSVLWDTPNSHVTVFCLKLCPDAIGSALKASPHTRRVAWTAEARGTSCLPDVTATVRKFLLLSLFNDRWFSCKQSQQATIASPVAVTTMLSDSDDDVPLAARAAPAAPQPAAVVKPTIESDSEDDVPIAAKKRQPPGSPGSLQQSHTMQMGYQSAWSACCNVILDELLGCRATPLKLHVRCCD